MDLVKDARILAISKKSPPKVLFEISKKKALELCDIFNEAGKNIVHVGVCLMDLMLSEASLKNKISEHVQMSVEAAKEFLVGYDISKKK